MNKVLILGRLGGDPEKFETQGGGAVVRLSVACDERRKQGDEWVQHTEWVRVVVFGRLAENVHRYKRKGDQVAVLGRLQTRRWEDRDGNTRYATEVVAREVEFVGGRRQEGGYSSGGNAGRDRGQGGGHAAGKGSSQGGGAERGGFGSGHDGSFGGQRGFVDDEIPF